MPPVTILLTRDKDCTGSIRYATKDKDAVVKNIYLDRKFADPMPERVVITIEPATISNSPVVPAAMPVTPKAPPAPSSPDGRDPSKF